MHKCRVNNKYTYFFIPNTGVALSFNNSVNVYQTTGYHITDDGNNHIHRRETLKSCTEIHRLHSYNAALTLNYYVKRFKDIHPNRLIVKVKVTP
jgi:hypothetical protein